MVVGAVQPQVGECVSEDVMAKQSIAEWERFEIERSSAEARRREDEQLRIADEIIDRYVCPSEASPFPLEYAYSLLGQLSDHTVLDYGCGAGENSVLLASRGARVIGIDISPDLLELARRRLALHGLGGSAEFRVASAHELPLDDHSVDIVFGMAILHHLELDTSAKEVHRVLRNGGRAIFLEPVRNSKFMRFVRSMIPYTQPDVSPYERPLTDSELERYGSLFTSYRCRAFHLPFVNLADVLALSESVRFAATRFDGRLLNRLPFLRFYATIRVYEMTK